MSVVVAYLSAVPWVAGAETGMLDLIRGLDRRRYEPVAILPEYGPLADELNDLDVPTRFVPFYGFKARNPFLYFRTIKGMADALRDFRASILHVNHQYCSNYGVLAAKLARRKVVCHVRGIRSEQFIPWLRRADRVLMVSKAVRRHMDQSGWYENGKSAIVYDGVSPSLDPPGERRSYALTSHPVVGYVGQFMRDKGLLDLVRAAPYVLESFPDAVFRFVGWDPRPDSDFGSAVREEARRLGVFHRCEFPGRRHDVSACVQEFTVTAMPTWEEGFGRVVVESMLAGTPVVASATGGILEIVEDKVSGVLVPPKNPKALAEGLLSVLRMGENERRAVADAARHRAGFFSVESHAQQIQALYDELLERGE